MGKKLYNYWLEIDKDGVLWAVTTYPNGMFITWEVNATTEFNGDIYLIEHE